MCPPSPEVDGYRPSPRKNIRGIHPATVSRRTGDIGAAAFFNTGQDLQLRISFLSPPMPQGYLALVLHAHLPFVRHPEYDEFLEEDWLYEAITETYIPLVNMMDGLLNDDCDFRLTMSITPPLASMLADELLAEPLHPQSRQVDRARPQGNQPHQGRPPVPRARLVLSSPARELPARFSSTSITGTCSPPSASFRTRASSRSSPAARPTATCR